MPGKRPKTSAGSMAFTEQPSTTGRRSMAGMDASQLKKLKELEEENRRLKRMYADISLDHALLKEVLEKKF
jgi:putative transposase